MREREALKLALEALEEIHVGNMTPMAEANWNKAIVAIKEALAQPEQEPVANGIIRTLISVDKDGIETWKHEPFYTTPPQRKPLTEKEILNLLPDAQHGWTTAIYGKWVARAIERAHGIKE